MDLAPFEIDQVEFVGFDTFIRAGFVMRNLTALTIGFRRVIELARYIGNIGWKLHDAHAIAAPYPVQRKTRAR